MKLQLGFLASYNGTDMKTIIEAVKAEVFEVEVKVVISNNSNALALEYARTHKIPAFHN